MAFVSCNKEEAKQEIKPVDGKIKVHFAAKTEELTKVSLTPEEDDTKFIAAWDALDIIDITSYVHGVGEVETVAGIWNADDECFETEFDPEFYEGEEVDFVGVWPVDVDADKLIPAVRTQHGASYNGQYDIMKSKRTDPVTLEDGATIILDMIRYTSIAYFHITSDLNEPIVSATLTTGEGEYIASSNATIGVEGFNTNIETAGVNSIKLNIDGEMSSSDFKLWFNVLPVQYTSMTLRVETANHSFSLAKKASGEWKVGELNKAVIKNVPEDKWAEIERPAGEKTVTLTMVSGNTSSYSSIDKIITATFDKNGGTDPTWNSTDQGLRLYYKGMLTLEAAGDREITRIVYNVISNPGGANKDKYVTPSTDKGSFDSNTWTWIGSESSVVLSLSGTAGNVAFKSIEVTYTDPNAPVDPIYKYSVMVDKDVTNGTVSVDKTSAKEGDEVTITATPSDGYELVVGSVKAYNAVSGAELTVTNNKFTMPAANVNVTAAFSLIPTLSATSPEPYASNLTNNSGKGFSIPVIANQAWVAAIKTDDPNAADITLMTSEGEGGENNNLVFSFNSQNTSPLVAKSTVVVLSPKNGNRPEPVEITITHEKRGATLVLNNDDKANVTANVAATETSYTANITAANFSEWSVLEYKIGDVAQSTTDANCVTIHNDGANTGSVTIGFPANASESNDVTITLKVGYEGIITKTLTLTQAAAAARTPNVTLDFTDNTNWNFPTSKVVPANTYSDGTTTITLKGTSGNGYSFNTQNKYLILGQNGATLAFQSFDFDVDRIKVYGRTGASSSVKQNIYVGDNAVSTETTGASGTNTYDINANYQASGNIYVLKVTSDANTQITKIEIFGGAPKTVTSVAVSGNPTKTSYEAGEVFNPAGLTVTANYDDGSSKAVTTGITWTDGNGNELAGLTAGTTSVTVKAVYKDIPSEAFIVNNLTVTAPKVLDHITVKTSPKVTYDAGDKFDPTNLVITKHFTDSYTEDVEYNSTTASAFTFNPSTSTALTTSNTSVRITYGGKSCDLTIKVNAPTSGYVTSLANLTSGTYMIIGQRSASSFAKLTYATLNSGRIPSSQSWTSKPASPTASNNNDKWILTVSGSGDTRTVTLKSVGGNTFLSKSSGGKIEYNTSSGHSFIVTYNSTSGKFSFQTASGTDNYLITSTSYWGYYAKSTAYGSNDNHKNFNVYLYRIN